jgi:hypothetical protein
VFDVHPGAALEYWFFKVNHGNIGLLVDWIARRRLARGSLRVSVHGPGGAQVIETVVPDVLAADFQALSSGRTSNREGEVRWDLEFRATDARVRPGLAIAERLGMFDLTYESAPWVTFNGWIEHAEKRFDVVDAAGMAAHYWGPRLMPEWWWLSANQFESTAKPMAVEFDLLRTHIWGTRAKTGLGYLWIDDGQSVQELISPPARITVAGDPASFTVTVRQLRGHTYRLVCTGRDYADLGDGIANTLVGDLEVWRDGQLIGKAVGTASLERRPYPAGQPD